MFVELIYKMQLWRLAVRYVNYTPAQKNQTGEIECQNNADLFLQHSRNCAQGIRSQGSDGQPGVLPGGFWNDWGRECGGQPELWQTGKWLIHHDNAPAHTALRIHQFLTSQGMTLVPHPPYSPDMAPADFFFVSPNEKGLERAAIWYFGRRYSSFDKSTEQHPTCGVPEMFRTVETEIG